MSDVTILEEGLVEVQIDPAPVIEVEAYSGGIVNVVNFSLEYQLTIGRLANQPSLYREFTYNGDNLTRIEAWATSSKTTKLLTTDFTYTGTNLTQKVLTDNVNGVTLTVTYGYTGDNLTSINEVFS